MRILLLSFALIVPSVCLNVNVHDKHIPCTGKCRNFTGIVDFDWSKHFGDWEVVYLPVDASSNCGTVSIGQFENQSVHLILNRKATKVLSTWRRAKLSQQLQAVTYDIYYNITDLHAGAYNFTGFQYGGVTSEDLYVIDSDPEKFLMLRGCISYWASPYTGQQFQHELGMLLKRPDVDREPIKRMFNNKIEQLGGCGYSYKITDKPEMCTSSYIHDSSDSSGSCSVSHPVTMLPRMCLIIILMAVILHSWYIE